MTTREAFSVRRNIRFLVDPPADGHFRSIDGIRALAVLWIIIMHCVWFQFPYLKFEDWNGRMKAVPRWIIGGPYGVDVFFVISGFLIGYILMKEHQKRGGIDIRRFYIRRFLKLMPAYIGALIVYCLVIGDNWQTAWANLIYINNFLPGPKQAMTWTWSLAIEEQFYFTFPCFLVFVFFRMKKHRLALLAGLLIAGVGIRAFLATRHNMWLPLPWSGGVTEPRFLDWAERMYIKPYARYGCLLTGVIGAYLYLFHGAANFFRARRTLATALFACCCAIFAALVAAPIHVAGPRWPAIASVATLATHRYILGAATTYIMMFSLFPAGPVAAAFNWFLSWRIWYTIAQLAYSAYLLHPIVLLVMLGAVARYGLLRIPMPIIYVAGPSLAFMAATPLYLFIERPFMNLRDASRPRPEEARGPFLLRKAA
jgi:peptidoglycan/LPS O-acetylase OafA/YrhL